MLVRGQYGLEQWDSDSREFTSPDEPAGLAAFRAELPRLLEAGHADGRLRGGEGARRRRAHPPDERPGAAFARLEPELADAAERHGLTLEPGKLVLEVRSPGMHKGHALRQVVADTDAGGVLFAGDDLGDLEAFEAARDLRGPGPAGPAGVLGLEEQAPSPTWPTSWSTAPTG